MNIGIIEIILNKPIEVFRTIFTQKKLIKIIRFPKKTENRKQENSLILF
jgi:uncharacterized protein YvpB